MASRSEHADNGGASEGILELARACIRFVKEALQVELDYTPDTLPILDHYVRERARKLEPGVEHLLVPATGAYFGEVVRRTQQGVRWHGAGDDYRTFRLEFASIFLHFNPFGVAVEVLESEDVGGWGAHFQVLDEARELVARALQGDGQVRAEDYYTFSIRYEALEQITALLVALEGERKSTRVFGPEVYRAANGETNGERSLS